MGGGKALWVECRGIWEEVAGLWEEERDLWMQVLASRWREGACQWSEGTCRWRDWSCGWRKQLVQGGGWGVCTEEGTPYLTYTRRWFLDGGGYTLLYVYHTMVSGWRKVYLN